MFFLGRSEQIEMAPSRARYMLSDGGMVGEGSGRTDEDWMLFMDEDEQVDQALARQDTG